MNFPQGYLLWSAAVNLMAVDLMPPAARLGNQTHSSCCPSYGAEFAIASVYDYLTRLREQGWVKLF